ncbi:uncharacterized protein K452DRAFT_49642 [Aplosporella prunicola CBS 121167]|uniref:Uncharacterized protein n=1 Tax=Aplosporella prunicola CBS 121167 TaxID=1176127 RepID=A0A6A6B8T8_9PEZI|nr:uncharacterized protein K452DRAFT_49642 [Aplosporella prunicola CBS 121167]KAF2140662.1 hypothetical protein K452DRAFT_49642 [Aplosporella prunicola CBS 121167]
MRAARKGKARGPYIESGWRGSLERVVGQKVKSWFWFRQEITVPLNAQRRIKCGRSIRVSNWPSTGAEQNKGWGANASPITH